MKKLHLICMMALVIFLCPNLVFAIDVPSNVIDISKENTYTNNAQDISQLEPSKLSKMLLDSSNVVIDNPELIRIFNESSFAKAPLSVGYKAKIYLGKWPLHYESTSTTINWQFKKINTNYLDNRGSNTPTNMYYDQTMYSAVKGGLTSSIEFEDTVKKMMLLKAIEKTKLSLAFQSVVGESTKTEKTYTVGAKQIGYLHGYAPAVSEKGKITFGEVYLILNGGKKSVVVKNVTTQGIGAWIPIQDKVTTIFASSMK